MPGILLQAFCCPRRHPCSVCPLTSALSLWTTMHMQQNSFKTKVKTIMVFQQWITQVSSIYLWRPSSYKENELCHILITQLLHPYLWFPAFFSHRVSEGELERERERWVMNWVTFNHVYVYVFVTLNILQSQFTEKGFKKTEKFEHGVALLFVQWNSMNLLFNSDLLI